MRKVAPLADADKIDWDMAGVFVAQKQGQCSE
jgi:hypothetical protein